jgi:hypothetical protein
MSTLTVSRYFADHPDELEGVKRATYAYHLSHAEPQAHYFDGSWREAACRWCGQTREGVRWNWYNRPPICEARPKRADASIQSVIAREEEQFEKVFDRAKRLAATLDLSELTGDELAQLHHTYGVDPSMLEVALMERGRSLPQYLHDAYQTAYAAHRATGRRSLVREVLTAKTV